MSEAEPTQPHVMKVTLKGVGPVTRHSGGDGALDDSAAIADGLHWIWSWRVQLARLMESHRLEWSGVTGADYRKAASQFSFDEHILTVTGWNLVRALNRIELSRTPVAIEEEHARALELLRHLYEHWDEQRPSFQSPDAPKRRSGAAFESEFPQGRPWTMVLDKTDWFLGGILPLKQFTRALDAIEAALMNIGSPPAGAP